MKQKQKINTPKRPKLWIISGLLLLALLFIGQMAFNLYVYLNLASTGDQTAITHAIINAARSVNKPAPVDPASGKVYLPEVRLVLPMAADSPQNLLYSSYTTDSGSTEPEIQITTSNIIRSAETKLWTSGQSVVSTSDKSEALFSEVPNLQACSRGVQIFFSEQDFDESSVQLRGTKNLSNGKTIYLYTDSACKENLNELVDYVKQVQSY